MKRGEKMSKYKKPKCTCGSLLILNTQEIWNCARRITQDGEIGDLIRRQTNWDEDMPEFKLSCPKCDKRYDGDYDDSNRIIRGEEIN
jgi:hypothetical protein